jgi:hypothetical protein
LHSFNLINYVPAGWGEDPHLTSVMGVASVKGLQGPVNASGYYSQVRIAIMSHNSKANYSCFAFKIGSF